MIEIKIYQQADFEPEGLKAEIVRRTASIMKGEASEAEKELKAALSKNGPKGAHSAPGEPPYQLSGNLSDSIKAETDTSGEETAIVLGDTEGRAPYAAALEYGTGKMKPRPFLWKAFLAMRDRIKTTIGNLYS